MSVAVIAVRPRGACGDLQCFMPASSTVSVMSGRRRNVASRIRSAVLRDTVNSSMILDSVMPPCDPAISRHSRSNRSEFSWRMDLCRARCTRQLAIDVSTSILEMQSCHWITWTLSDRPVTFGRISFAKPHHFLPSPSNYSSLCLMLARGRAQWIALSICTSERRTILRKMSAFQSRSEGAGPCQIARFAGVISYPALPCTAPTLMSMNIHTFLTEYRSTLRGSVPKSDATASRTTSPTSKFALMPV